MSAVSKNVTPASSAASTTARVPSRSTRRPKLLQPSPTTVACRLPRLFVSTLIQPLLDQPPRDRDRRGDVQRTVAAHRDGELVAFKPAHVLELAVAHLRLAARVAGVEA